MFVADFLSVFKACQFLLLHSPFCRARQPGQSGCAGLHVLALPAGWLSSVLSKIVIGSSTPPTWLSDDCADKPLSHRIHRVSGMKWPLLLSSSMNFKPVWPGHGKCRQKKSNSELPLTSVNTVSPRQSHSSPRVCVAPSTGPRRRLTRKREDFFPGGSEDRTMAYK